MLRASLTLVAALLVGCSDPGPCASVADPDASAASLVHDPLVGQHMGTLTWLETMKTTSIVLGVTATGPVSHLAPTPSSDSCTAGHYIALNVSVQTGDGLIQASFMPAVSMTLVDPSGNVDVGLDLAVDPAPILAGGAAPEEPNLSAQTAHADLLLQRASGAPTGGTLTIASPNAHVTLATVAF